jgi:hypothetical protein
MGADRHALWNGRIRCALGLVRVMVVIRLGFLSLVFVCNIHVIYQC